MVFVPDKCPCGGFPSIRHNELRNLTADLLSEVCSDFGIEPPLSPWIMNRSIMPQPIVVMVHVLMWWHRTFGVGVDSMHFLTLGCLTLLQAAIPDLFCLGAA